MTSSEPYFSDTDSYEYDEKIMSNEEIFIIRRVLVRKYCRCTPRYVFVVDNQIYGYDTLREARIALVNITGGNASEEVGDDDDDDIVTKFIVVKTW